MKLVVGLGNPGSEYDGTRHNVGFRVLEDMAREYRFAWAKARGIAALTAKGRIGGQDVVLAKPLTYMNLSGSAVAGLCAKQSVEMQDLLVVCDDLDLEFGRIRIKPSGSSGGQRGMESVIQALGTREFARVRIGIGRPAGGDVSEYVLSPFRREERAALPGVIGRARECAECWVCDGITVSMNKYNSNETPGLIG
jgi:peptidyl-tRNA hydrolase, PTH1 family